MDLPANVTNAYTKDDTSSTSCVSTLGQACVDALLAPEGTFDDGFTQNPQLLCMRVNATKLSTVDTNGDGVTLTSEAVFESTGYSV